MKLIIIAIFVLSLGLLNSETITIAADQWEPYNGDPESDKPGYVVELGREIFKEAGIEFNYINLPWARAVDSAEKGEIDGVIGAFEGEAPGCLYPDEEVNYSINVFLVKKDNNWIYEDVTSLESIQLGVALGYDYTEEIDEYIRNNSSPKVQSIGGENPIDQNFRKLLAGRIDAFISDNNVLDYYLSSSESADLVKKAGSAGNEKVYIAFSEKNPKAKDYAKIWDEGIKRYRENGKLLKILDRYGLKDWKK